MVDVIKLESDDALPDGEVSVVVGPAEDGSGMPTRRSWTYFSYLPNVPGAREREIAEARSYAEEQGIERVYVLDAPLGQHAVESEASAVMPMKIDSETA